MTVLDFFLPPMANFGSQQKLPGKGFIKLDQKTFEKIARIIFSNRPERNKVMDTLDSYIGKQFNKDGKSVEIGDVYVDEIGQTELSSVDGKLITSFLSSDFYKNR